MNADTCRSPIHADQITRLMLRTVSRSVVLASLSLLAHADERTDGIEFARDQLTNSNQTLQDNQSNIPHNNSNPPQAASFGSDADPFDLGSKRIGDCKTEAKSGNAMADQECEAVNFLAENPDNRVRYEISPSDPIVLANTQDARTSQFPGSTPIGANPGTCEEVTTPAPAETAINTCSAALASSCAVGKQIPVVAGTEYRCDSTHNGTSNPSCQTQLQVTCSVPDGCSAGGYVSGTLTGPGASASIIASTGFQQLFVAGWTVPKNRFWGEHRQFTFEMTDRSKINHAVFNSLRYNGYTIVMVNRNVVFTKWPNLVGSFGTKLPNPTAYEQKNYSYQVCTKYQPDKTQPTICNDDGCNYPLKCVQSNTETQAYLDLGSHCVTQKYEVNCDDYGCSTESPIPPFCNAMSSVGDENGTDNAILNADIRGYLKTGLNVVDVYLWDDNDANMSNMVITTQPLCADYLKCEDKWLTGACDAIAARAVQ